MKPTPGPWRTKEWDVRTAGGRTLADVYGEEEQAQADARLMAAAPTLLDACRVALRTSHAPECARHDGGTLCDCHLAVLHHAIGEAVDDA